MDESATKVFVQVDSKNNITNINSSIFLNDTTGWIQIGEGHGDIYAHAQGNFLPGPVCTDDGIPRWKLDENNRPAERTPEEISADLAATQPGVQEPTLEERMQTVEGDIDALSEAILEVLS
jgi:hypothetical protein